MGGFRSVVCTMCVEIANGFPVFLSSSELTTLLLHVPNFAAAAAVLWDGLMS
jgi:hypothetical protein